MIGVTITYLSSSYCVIWIGAWPVLFPEDLDHFYPPLDFFYPLSLNLSQIVPSAGLVRFHSYP